MNNLFLFAAKLVLSEEHFSEAVLLDLKGLPQLVLYKISDHPQRLFTEIKINYFWDFLIFCADLTSASQINSFDK